MTFETGLEEIALENLQASNARLRGDSELPTREMVRDAMLDKMHEASGRMGLSLRTNHGSHQDNMWQLASQAVKALIERGFLQVRG